MKSPKFPFSTLESLARILILIKASLIFLNHLSYCLVVSIEYFMGGIVSHGIQPVNVDPDSPIPILCLRQPVFTQGICATLRCTNPRLVRERSKWLVQLWLQGEVGK